jgi:RimJ/RimL family protein N-acetyltransferase
VAQACLDYGFGVAGLEAVIGLVSQQNTASIGVLEKCGMEHVGPGRYYDMDVLVYSATPP